MQDAGSTIQKSSDRECLASWACHRDAESLQTLVERYLGLVHSSALRRTGDAAQAAEVTRAVFLVLVRRARRLRQNTVLAGWLFDVTAVACRKLKRVSRLRRLWRWLSRQSRPALPPDAPLWARLAPPMDRALDRLRTKQRNAVLLCAFLNHDAAFAATILRTSERRVEQRLQRGLNKLAKRLPRRCGPVAAADLLSACATEGCSATLPEALSVEILAAMDENRGKRPSLKLARQTLRSLAWRRWRRRCLISASAFGLLLAMAGAAFWYVDGKSGHTWTITKRIEWTLAWHRKVTPAEAVRPWPANPATPGFDARHLRNAAELYRTTNIWPVHLTFTPEQWQALAPKHIPPLTNFILPDGRWLLRNPAARRSGLLGVLGLENDWSQAQCEFGQVSFTNVAARVKGNVAALWDKRPFKLDLNKLERGQKLGGLDELTFDNLAFDGSCMHEALAYECFRDAGVPAPRTAYAWLSLSVAAQWERKPMGLYLMEEAVDGAFLAERFGSRKTPLFKPSTYHLFEYLGDDWSAYAPIYDLKTKATPAQRRRIIEFARLVTFASDREFAERVGGFLDLDEFARFLAVQVLLPNYDSILFTGQNYYLYLGPSSNQFGFIPWDLDAAWGNFWIATKAQQQQSSIWRPWVGANRFLERVMAVEEFRRVYRAHLEDFLARLYVPERLNRRIDAMAAAIREPIAAESAYRLDKLDQTAGWKPLAPAKWWDPLDVPACDLKPFIAARARSVHSQLVGESPGLILKYPKRW